MNEVTVMEELQKAEASQAKSKVLLLHFLLMASVTLPFSKFRATVIEELKQNNGIGACSLGLWMS